MKAIPPSALQIARALGLVRGIRMVRVPHEGRASWAVALRFLGRWWLAARPRQGLFSAGRGAGGAESGPLLLATIGDARNFLDEMGL
jgi:hypothetical protein